MKDWKIYHNPRCSKSREALAFLQSKGIEPEIVEYLAQPLHEAELRTLLGRLDGPLEEVVRVKDDAFKAAPFVLDAGTISKELASRPELMERPIIVNKKGAVVARPLSKLEKLF